MSNLMIFSKTEEIDFLIRIKRMIPIRIGNKGWEIKKKCSIIGEKDGMILMMNLKKIEIEF